MSIEIPNRILCAGVFDGQETPDTPDPIVSSDQIQPFNPATTDVAPLGGFTRIAEGEYLVKMIPFADPFEAFPVFNPLVAGASLNGVIIPAIPALEPLEGTGDGHSIPIVSLLAAEGTAQDTSFYMFVLRYVTGPSFADTLP